MLNRDDAELTAAHHALLFAWIAREVIARTGTAAGEAALRAAVRRYGEQRGRRMALRARADGQPLTTAVYRAYGEWTVPSGEMEMTTARRGADLETRIYRCSWHTAWQDEGLVAYGRLYCLEIDEALMRGFNPDLRLDVNRTQPEGDEYCEHVYRDVGVEMPRRGAVLPWSYHVGHLYKTVGEVVVERLGQVGVEALDAALGAFAGRYGERVARVVLAYADADFDRLPE